MRAFSQSSVSAALLSRHGSGQSTAEHFSRRAGPDSVRGTLEHYRERYGFSLHAYVLMSNYVDSLVQTQPVAIRRWYRDIEREREWKLEKKLTSRLSS